MMPFERDRLRSYEAFERLVKPWLKSELLGWDFYSLESQKAHSEGINAHLDEASGIDAWAYKNGDRSRTVGIGARVQFGEKNWRTFTIRKSRISGVRTEYEKRKQAIKDQSVYPQWTLHAYVSEDGKDLLGVALARTSDILKCIDDGMARTRNNGREPGRECDFFYVEWSSLARSRCPMRIYQRDDMQQKPKQIAMDDLFLTLVMDELDAVLVD